MIRFMLTAVALAVSGAALAKLPAPVLDEAAKAKAAETAARTAWQAKVDAFKLCKAQDRVVAWVKTHPPANAAAAAGTAPAAPAAAATATAAPAAAAAAPAAAATPTAAPAAAAAAKAPVPTAVTASQGGGTPNPAVASAALPVPPCSDPGPFAYTPPSEKPLETSGAHSPPGTASSPPSVRTESGEMTSGKTGAKK